MDTWRLLVFLLNAVGRKFGVCANHAKCAGLALGVHVQPSRLPAQRTNEASLTANQSNSRLIPSLARQFSFVGGCLVIGTSKTPSPPPSAARCHRHLPRTGLPSPRCREIQPGNIFDHAALAQMLSTEAGKREEGGLETFPAARSIVAPIGRRNSGRQPAVAAAAVAGPEVAGLVALL